MEDAERKTSLCNDHFARRFMDERGMRLYQPFTAEKLPNISTTVRCRIIDDFVRSEIEKEPGTRVVTIGAGFDTRPYRLKGGDWIEIDEPQIIEYKNERLPVAECPNSLKRISIEFAAESLAGKLETLANDKPVVVVMEGVFMYLEAAQIDSTLRDIKGRFPRHVLLCDLMNREFFEKVAQSVHSKLAAAGAVFTERPDDPAEIFRRNGYMETANVPMFRRAMELGVLWDRARIPGFVARLLLGVLRKEMNGFAVRRFIHG
jgi:methyltransferase (TIGR00027 family)